MRLPTRRFNEWLVESGGEKLPARAKKVLQAAYMVGYLSGYASGKRHGKPSPKPKKR